MHTPTVKRYNYPSYALWVAMQVLVYNVGLHEVIGWEDRNTPAFDLAQSAADADHFVGLLCGQGYPGRLIWCPSPPPPPASPRRHCRTADRSTLAACQLSHVAAAARRRTK
jgi:hypothetical protein